MAFNKFSGEARRRRAAIFRNDFDLGPETKILDLGSEDGSNIARVIEGTAINQRNVFLADISESSLKAGEEKFGFQTIFLKENEKLPVEDNFFDIVYCSSAIEHVTIPKSELWKTRSRHEFARRSWQSQTMFAKEVIRVGKQYFVQTPCKTFPLESHTWLPFVGYLPREVFLIALSISNRVWVKNAEPDFNLLGRAEMQKLFPAARIISEVKFGMTKSLIAVKSDKYRFTRGSLWV